MAWRAPGFAFSEVNWDEQLYLLIAHSVAQGNLPYAEIWDRKPAGLFFLLGAVATLVDAPMLSLRLLPALGLGLGAWCLAEFVHRLAPGGRAGGGIAGLLWIAYAGRADGGGLNTELLFVPLNLLGIVLLLRAATARDFVTAGLLLGAALQIKYNACFTWLAIPAVWAILRWRGPTPPEVAATLAGLVLPSLLVIAPFIAAGRLGLWWEANIGANLTVVQSIAANAGAPWRLVTGEPGYMALRHGVPLVGGLLAIAAIWLAPRGERAPAVAVVLALTAADACALLVLGRFTDHMMIQLLPGPCIAAGCLAHWLLGRRAVGAAALALLLGIAVLRDGRGFLDPFVAAAEILARRGAGVAEWGDPVATAALRIGRELRPEEAIYAFGGPILGLYAALRRPPPTRFPFAEHLWKPYAPAAGAAEMARILGGAPRVIAVTLAWAPGQAPPEPAAAAGFALLHQSLARHYAPIATIAPFVSQRGGPIGPRQTIVIFRRLASPMAED